MTKPIRLVKTRRDCAPLEKEPRYDVFLDGELRQPAGQRAVLATADPEDESFGERAAQVVLEEVHPQPDLGLRVDRRLDAEFFDDLGAKGRHSQNPSGVVAAPRAYVRHTGQSLAEVEAKMERDTFMSAEQAKEFGIIDEVIEKRPAKPQNEQ